MLKGLLEAPCREVQVTQRTDHTNFSVSSLPRPEALSDSL